MSAELIRAIERDGLLPMHDAYVRSATALVAKEPVRGSWWAHPKANTIFRAITAAEDDSDVELVKLLGGKLTFVHRRLWLPLWAAVTEGAEWQTHGLSRSVEELLERVTEQGSLRGEDFRELKKETKAIEDRMLAFVTSVHTESGHHEKVIEDWEVWRKRVLLKGRKPAASAGRAALEEAAAPFAPLRLPWVKRKSA